jgi:hypothetical protein
MRGTGAGLLIATALSSAACHTMRPVALEELGAIRPTRVWVTRSDQSKVVVEGPRFLDSGLVGFVNGSYQEIPAADVKQVLQRRRAGGRTGALVAVGALGAFTLAYLIAGSSNVHDPGAYLDCGDNPDQPGCPGVPP